MIQIIHFEKGKMVNTGAEYLEPEYIFAFDENNNFIQKFTYPVDISYENLSTLLTSSDKTINIEEDSFFYYSLWTQVSYAHYMTQVLPKLLYYNHRQLFVIPRSTYNNLFEEIVKNLKIDEDKILILEDNVKYIFKNLTVIPHHHYQGPGGILQDDILNVFRLLRNNLNITISKPYRKVFLKKDGKSDENFGNSELGIHRKIVNSEELENYLKSEKFEIIHLGDKSFEQKVELLADIKILITQLGANCMNLAFSNSPENILMLSNDLPIGPEYYINLCNILNSNNSYFEVYRYPSLNYKEDLRNGTNSPFLVNIDDVKKFIEKLNK